MRYDTRNRTSLSLRPNQSTTSMRPVLGRGEKGQDGSNVLPTDEAIADAIDTPGSDTATSLNASYAGRVEPFGLTLNADGSVATETIGGLVTTYAYNSDGTLHTATRGGVTITYAYDATGNMTGAA